MYQVEHLLFAICLRWKAVVVLLKPGQIAPSRRVQAKQTIAYRLHEVIVLRISIIKVVLVLVQRIIFEIIHIGTKFALLESVDGTLEMGRVNFQAGYMLILHMPHTAWPSSRRKICRTRK
jgi:hypothetical protein